MSLAGTMSGLGKKSGVLAAVAAALALTAGGPPRAAAGVPSAVPPGRPGAQSKIAGPLRLAQRLATRTGSVALQSQGTRGAANRAEAEALVHTFVVAVDDPGEDPEGPRVTFKAILDTDAATQLDALRAAGARIRGHVGRVVSFEAPIGAAQRFAAIPSLQRLDIARQMKPELDVSVPETGAPVVWDPNGSFGVQGKGVLVAVMDSGQDLRHKDFRNPGGKKFTRFESVFNMQSRCIGSPPPGHTKGCYYKKRRINKFLKGKVQITYSDPASLEGHGTHVTGIAAGNGLGHRRGTPNGVFVGMAPQASLLGVKLFNGKGNFVGDITEALQYFGEEQARLGGLPLVVNMSLGHQFGAHDGSDPDELAIDAFVDEGTTNGTPRVVVKSAGNSALDGVHISGTAATSGVQTHFFTVPGGGSCVPLSGTGNDSFVADFWYEGDVVLNVKVTSPGGFSFDNTTGNSPTSVETDTSQGTIFVDCPDVPSPVNNSRECVFGVDDSGGKGPAAGTWRVDITGVTIPGGDTGDYDAWVALASRGSCTWGWDGAGPESSITIPGTSQKGLTVGAYVTKVAWTDIDGNVQTLANPPALFDIADFSSQGPTRDGRVKPDLVAPGLLVASSRAHSVSIAPGTVDRLFTMPDGTHILNAGTSMSAPHVTGAAALLLSLNPALTAGDVRTLLLDNASSKAIPPSPPLPNNVWGAGKLDVAAAAAGAVP